jgi:RNA polymerase sigma-70 factor (ECF subfamily)
VRDDQLRLIFTCCHPALAPQARVALALRVLCGLEVAQIAAVMLTGEAAMAKRLTRTRQKIARARIPYRVPGENELPQRLSAVCGVIHSLYTVGHGSDAEVCREAVRLARLLCELMPGRPMPAAVLSLLLLTEARRPSRTSADGEVVTLDRQDRSLWDACLVAEGLHLLDSSLRHTGGVADPYQLQAAIAAVHASAPSYADTDWPEIVRLYDLLVDVAPSDPARLARAVAIAEADGAQAGLAATDGLSPGSHWHAVRAELLARLGRYPEAIAEIDRSLQHPGVTDSEHRHRVGQRAQWLTRQGCSGTPPGIGADGS